VVVLAGVLTAVSGRYGFHRDELYFMTASDHLAWGYVDQPPLTPFITGLVMSLFGETPAGVRVAATLAFAATVVVVALVARELGAGPAGQAIASCCAAVSGFVLGLGHMVSTATFDLLAWVTICWLILRLLRTGDGHWWVPIGAVAGISLLNKYLVVLLLVAVLVALLATGQRRTLRSGWLVVGVVVGLVLAGPTLWWQATHGWPQLSVAGGISSDDGVENRVMFVPLQLLQLSPLLVPIWVAGFVRLWRDPAMRWARPIAWAYPVLAVMVLLVGGKPYYALPLLIVIMAAGGEAVAAWIRRGRRAVRGVVVGVGLALAAVTSAVVALPVLPPDALSVVNAINREQGEQIGWPELVAAAARGWAQVSPDNRARAVVFTQNYGQAGAIDRYGPRYGLPQAYSGHMSYSDWGPPPDSADGPVLVVRQADGAGMERFFTDCREVARVDNGVGVENEEQGSVIALCSGTVEPWSTLWPKLRHFY
jgi:4-amino-4-deoxy-L-arabinose transferase-like glycosyltransferase